MNEETNLSMKGRLNQVMEGNPIGDYRSIHSSDAQVGGQVHDGLVTLGGACTDDMNLQIVRYETPIFPTIDNLRRLVFSNHLFLLEPFRAHNQLEHLTI